MGICIASLVKCLFMSFPYSLIGLLDFYCYFFYSSLCILDACLVGYASPTTHTLYYCNHVISFEIRLIDSSNFILPFTIVLEILFSLLFHINFRIISIFTKNHSKIWTGFLLNLHINLEKIGIFIILNLLIHEYIISLFILVFLIYFISILSF